MQEQRQLCSFTIKSSQRIFINLSAFVSMLILETLINVLNTSPISRCVHTETFFWNLKLAITTTVTGFSPFTLTTNFVHAYFKKLLLKMRTIWRIFKIS